MNTNPYLIEIDTLTYWQSAIRRQGDPKQFRAPESALSFPFPLQSELRSLGYFVYVSSIHSDLKSYMSFPHLLLSIDYPALNQIETYAVPEDWAELSAVFPVVRSVQQQDARVERIRYRQFADFYEAIVNLYPAVNPGPLAPRFLELFSHFSPMVMQTFYERMNPDFWRWLRAAQVEGE